MKVQVFYFFRDLSIRVFLTSGQGGGLSTLGPAVDPGPNSGGGDAIDDVADPMVEQLSHFPIVF